MTLVIYIYKCYCVAHNGAIIPVPGRDIFIQAWYQGGISVIDFTDSSNPTEIAYFDRGPILEDELITGGYWSVYYYEGSIYGTEITRGLDVFKLIPSNYLSENEIAAAELAYPAIGPERLFNPQQQIPMEWPADPVVALSYLDQLKRLGAVEEDVARNINDLLNDAIVAEENYDQISKKAKRQLSRRIKNISFETNAEPFGRLSETAVTNERTSRIQNLLRANLDEIAEKLN